MKNLYIKQAVFKITDHYPVLNEEGQEVYYVDEEFKFLEKTYHVKDAQGNPVFTVVREPITFLPRFVVYFEKGDQLILQSRFRILSTKIDVTYGNKKLNIVGDAFSLHFELESEGRTVARLGRKFIAWGDTYNLEILDEAYE